jgi:vacuolar-type H+-ATPase subunit I/STV1
MESVMPPPAELPIPMPSSDFSTTVNEMVIKLNSIQGNIMHIADKRNEDHNQINKLIDKIDAINEKIHELELKLDKKINDIKVELAKFSAIISITTAVIVTCVAAYIKR